MKKESITTIPISIKKNTKGYKNQANYIKLYFLKIHEKKTERIENLYKPVS